MQFLISNNLDGTTRVYNYREAVAKIATFMREVRGHSDKQSGIEAENAVADMATTGDSFDATMKDGTVQFSIAPGRFIPQHDDELAKGSNNEPCLNEDCDCHTPVCAGSFAPMNATGKTKCEECGTEFEANATVS